MKKSNYLLIALGVFVAILSIIVVGSFITIEPISLAKSTIFPAIDMFNINTVLNLIFQK